MGTPVTSRPFIYADQGSGFNQDISNIAQFISTKTERENPKKDSDYESLRWYEGQNSFIGAGSRYVSKVKVGFSCIHMQGGRNSEGQGKVWLAIGLIAAFGISMYFSGVFSRQTYEHSKAYNKITQFKTRFEGQCQAFNALGAATHPHVQTINKILDNAQDYFASVRKNALYNTIISVSFTAGAAIGLVGIAFAADALLITGVGILVVSGGIAMFKLGFGNANEEYEKEAIRNIQDAYDSIIANNQCFAWPLAPQSSQMNAQFQEMQRQNQELQQQLQQMRQQQQSQNSSTSFFDGLPTTSIFDGLPSGSYPGNTIQPQVVHHQYNPDNNNGNGKSGPSSPITN